MFSSEQVQTHILRCHDKFIFSEFSEERPDKMFSRKEFTNSRIYESSQENLPVHPQHLVQAVQLVQSAYPDKSSQSLHIVHSMLSAFPEKINYKTVFDNSVMSDKTKTTLDNSDITRETDYNISIISGNNKSEPTLVNSEISNTISSEHKIPVFNDKISIETKDTSIISDEISSDTNVDITNTSDEITSETNVDISNTSDEISNEMDHDISDFPDKISSEIEGNISIISEEITNETDVEIPKISDEISSEKDYDISYISEEIKKDVDVENINMMNLNNLDSFDSVISDKMTNKPKLDIYKSVQRLKSTQPSENSELSGSKILSPEETNKVIKSRKTFLSKNYSRSKLHNVNHSTGKNKSEIEIFQEIKDTSTKRKLESESLTPNLASKPSELYETDDDILYNELKTIPALAEAGVDVYKENTKTESAEHNDHYQEKDHSTQIPLEGLNYPRSELELELKHVYDDLLYSDYVYSENLAEALQDDLDYLEDDFEDDIENDIETDTDDDTEYNTEDDTEDDTENEYVNSDLNMFHQTRVQANLNHITMNSDIKILEVQPIFSTDLDIFPSPQIETEFIQKSQKTDNRQALLSQPDINLNQKRKLKTENVQHFEYYDNNEEVNNDKGEMIWARFTNINRSAAEKTSSIEETYHTKKKAVHTSGASSIHINQNTKNNSERENELHDLSRKVVSDNTENEGVALDTANGSYLMKMNFKNISQNTSHHLNFSNKNISSIYDDRNDRIKNVSLNDKTRLLHFDRGQLNNKHRNKQKYLVTQLPESIESRNKDREERQEIHENIDVENTNGTSRTRLQMGLRDGERSKKTKEINEKKHKKHKVDTEISDLLRLPIDNNSEIREQKEVMMRQNNEDQNKKHFHKTPTEHNEHDKHHNQDLEIDPVAEDPEDYVYDEEKDEVGRGHAGRSLECEYLRNGKN